MFPYPYFESGAYGNVGMYGMSTYGSLTLTEASPVQVFAEPLTIEEVGSFLKLSEDEWTLEQDTINALISGARAEAEKLQGRDLIRKQWDLVMDYWPYRPSMRSAVIELRDPLVSVDLLKYRDSTGSWTTLTENVDYVVDPSKHPGIVTTPTNNWWPSFTPWPSSSILLRFTSGMDASSQFWTEGNAQVKNGMKFWIADRFYNRTPRVLGRGESEATSDPIGDMMSHGSLLRGPRG